ncbi:MAG: DUF885 family protein [Pseudomonadota bacterium]
MVSNLGEPQVSQVIQSIADCMFETLVETFPVCSASDEFHYFPQIQPPQRDWFVWDDFSPETVEEVARKLSMWEEALRRPPGNHLGQNALIDVSMIRRVASTLREELTEVRFQQTQPTFYLTIAGIGLAEVLDHDQIAWENRVRGLPRFLDRARMNLDCIPTLFRDLGLEMARDTKAWLASIGGSRSGLGPVLTALERFEDHLRIVSTRESFLLAPELLERIISHHVGCAMEIQEIREELNEEIVEMEKIMNKESQRVNPGRSWQEAVESIPLAPLPEDGILGLYRNAVLDAGEHCLQQGLITHDLFHACPVRVEPTPVYLSAVRSAAGYSMPPGHPPSGGTFFIVDLDIPNDQRQLLHRDCRMVAAHETYPGHHLLDASRWNLERVMRRPIEFPLFYEGGPALLRSS